jgi:hypothetical protein
MIRYLLTAAAIVALLAVPAEAKRVAAPASPVEKVARAEAVVVGKVTALEKDLVTVAAAPGSPDKVSYQVAVVKVEAALVGAANATHVKVGFVPPPKGEPAPGRPGRGGVGPGALAEGAEGLFFLSKHPTADFYTLSPLLAPVETTATDYKAQVELAKRTAAALADPLKALKADKPADRGFAATALVLKYRSYPFDGGTVETAKVSAEESKLILKGLAEANWKGDPNDALAVAGYQAFARLGLTDTDGWKPPVPKPGDDFIDATRTAFAKWLDGTGAEYRIGKFVKK